MYVINYKANKGILLLLLLLLLFVQIKTEKVDSFDDDNA